MDSLNCMPPMNPGNPDRRAGFSLIEVLVALTVLALALSALIKTGSSNAANAGFLQDKTFAQWVAMNELARMQAMQEYPSVGKQKGSSELADREFFWTVITSDTPAETMRRVEIEVREEEDSEGVITILVGFVSEPLESSP